MSEMMEQSYGSAQASAEKALWTWNGMHARFDGPSIMERKKRGKLEHSYSTFAI